jgi:hypothetical protein
MKEVVRICFSRHSTDTLLVLVDGVRLFGRDGTS